VHKEWAKAGLAPELISYSGGQPGNYFCIVMPDLGSLGYKMVSSLSPEERAEAKTIAKRLMTRVPPGTGAS
jgi:hypothetical protein